nr:ComEC/Rec2 family competence protein [Planctomycetota bacterium]
MASALSQPGSASLPLVPVACATTAGAAMAHAPSGAAVTALALPCILALLVLTPRMRTALLAVLLGLLLGRLTSAPVARPPELVGARLPAVYRLEGRILQIDPTASRTQAFTLDVDRLGAQRRALARASRVDVRLRLRGPAPWRDGDLMPGARIDVLARVYERRGRLRAYVHDRRAVHVVEPAGQTERAVAELRRRAAWSFSRRFDRRDDGLARALLLGDRGRLDHGDRSLFRLTGQAHLLAVSGLHVGLLLGGLLLLLRVVGASPRLLWSTGIVAAAFYVPFTGAQPSVVRAGLGAATWFLARLAGRRPRGAAVLTTVAVLVVVGRPAAVGEPAFQLSFAAVASIFLLGGPLRRRLVPERPVIPGLLPPRRAPLRSALAISTAAWLGTAPFVATYIGRLCPAGPALSLVALPLTAVLLASGCLVLLAAPLPPLASLAGGVFELAAEALRAALEAASAVRLHAWDVARPTGLWWVLYGVAVLAAARSSPGASRMPWLALPALLGLLFVPGGLPLLSRAREDG